MSHHLSDYPDNVIVVRTFKEMTETPFNDSRNVILRPRQLNGDFNAVAQHVLTHFPRERSVSFGYSHRKSTDDFLNLANALESIECRAALEQIAADVRALTKIGYGVQIRLQRHSSNKEKPHVDGFRDRILTNYCGATTLGWQPKDVDTSNPSNPIIAEGAQPFRMRLGDMWRQKCKLSKGFHPFVHSVPTDNTEIRMLMVASPLS
jgi:hypothetical protein